MVEASASRNLDARTAGFIAGAVAIAAVLGAAIALDVQVAIAAMGACGLVLVLSVAPGELILWAMLLVVAVFPGTAYGQAAGSTADTLFSRGSGVLPLPVFDLVLMAAAFFCIGRFLRAGRPWMPPLVLLFALVAAYSAAVAIAVAAGSSLASSLTGTGGRLLLVATSGAFITATAIRDTRAATRLLTVVQILGFVLAAFGLARYVWAGGDPSNPYLDYSGINVHLTYYENAYAVLMTAAFWIALLRWVPRAPSTLHAYSKVRLVFDTLTIILTIAALLLTYRRTNYLAVVVGAGCLILVVRRARWLLVAGTAAAVLSFNLLQQARDLAGSWIILFETSGEDPRKNELLLAWQSVSSDPIGQGVFGHYKGTPGAGWPATPDIVHDVFLWIGLKIGWIGIAITATLLVMICIRLLNVARSGDVSVRQTCYVLLALFGTWLIAFSFATPLLETRMAVLFGLWVGLAARVSRPEPVSHAQSDWTGAT
jgi:hypothetical protein